ncbi:MAG: hypothetical protein HKP39_08755 [Eudoraea sp.]|nr:hypothetical protein [Eudoraea sp.]
MKSPFKLPFYYLFLSFSLMLGTALAFAQDGEHNATPSLLLGQGDQLPGVKAGLEAGNPDLVAALKEIVEDANTALEQPIANVVDEGALPPSGDPHDYYSYSPYWWPDSENPDGPYIWRDGVTNPDRYTSDVSRLETMCDAVRSLVLAWYFTHNDRYAKRAATRSTAGRLVNLACPTYLGRVHFEESTDYERL